MLPRPGGEIDQRRGASPGGTLPDMIELLRSVSPYSELDWQLLSTVARHARVINLPAGRVLHQPGRVLKGSYHLLRGRLRAQSPARVLSAARQTVYPGCSGLVSLTPVQLLHVDTDPISFLFVEADAEPEPTGEPDGWQLRFLRSHMLSGVPQSHWQRILRALTPVSLPAGSAVIRRGEHGACCYILAAGQAKVVRGKHVLRRLAPGDFFGEDALLAGAPRNASVIMTAPGTVMALEESCFRRWLGDVLVGEAGEDQESTIPRWRGNQQSVHLRVSGVEGLREQLGAIDPCVAYRIDGPDAAARLAVFLLRQRGVRAELCGAASAGQALTVRPSAQARRAAMDSPCMTDMG